MKENNKIKRTVNLYPIISAFTGDMILFVPIDTLFLTLVKCLSPAQISMMTTVSLLISIALRKFILIAIKKLGNCNSIKLGILLLLLSAYILAFSKTFILLIAYKCINEIASMFLGMDKIVLKNNLICLNREADYYRIRNKTKILYSFLTMIAAIIAGTIFNCNQYLPLYVSIGIFLIMLVVSFMMYETPIVHNSKRQNENTSFQLSHAMILLLIFNAVSIAIIKNGQSNSKLFIQYDFQSIMSIENVTYYITIIVLISRIVRLGGNFLFGNIYLKVKDGLVVILSILLCTSFGLLILGFIMPVFQVKIILMSIGFFLILGTRDSFQVYVEDIALKLSDKDIQQQIMLNVEISRKIGVLFLNITCTLILIKQTLLIVEIVLFCLALGSIFLSLLLYKSLQRKSD